MTTMTGHLAMANPLAWLQRWAPLVRKGGTVLDVACGGGRHARFFAALGHPVDAVDRDPAAIAALAAVPRVTARCADIENGPWPYPGRTYAAVVVTHYLHRPLFPVLLSALAPGGLLIYETFGVGNAAYGRPVNPAFLLRPRELLEVVGTERHVLGYENGFEASPKPAVIQRICVLNKLQPDVDQNLNFFLNS